MYGRPMTVKLAFRTSRTAGRTRRRSGAAVRSPRDAPITAQRCCLTTAMLAFLSGKLPGHQRRRPGAVTTSRGAAGRRPHRCPTIAVLATKVGRLVGPKPRSLGAVPTSAVPATTSTAPRGCPRAGRRSRQTGAAIKRAQAVQRQALIAMQVSPSGSLAGQMRRRTGVASTIREHATVTTATRAWPISSRSGRRKRWIFAVRRQERAARERGLLFRTTAKLAMTTGKPAGQNRRRSGAVPIASVAALNLRLRTALLTTAMQASTIGRRVGRMQRKSGAALNMPGAALKLPPAFPTTVRLASAIGKLAGLVGRRSGAASTSIGAVRRRATTAMLASQTGRPDGRRKKRSGVARLAIWAAKSQRPTTARLDIQIGRQVGPMARRTGAANITAKAALPRLL
mmetsp:Transcript_30147/g.54657  ORF Transcript_30147/g.54657 Transcript_30147/m.54657 type:complete len:398 (-) Transcript_30147:427-1620(-)